MGKKIGRPAKEDRYDLTEEQKSRALVLAIEGKTTTYIADELCMTQYDFWKARQHDPSFSAKYNDARREGVHSQVDRLDNIHEEHPDPQVMRVISDNIKWKASKLNSTIYGDRLDLNVNHTVDIGGALKEARQRASAISTKGQGSLPVPDRDKDIIDITPVPDRDRDKEKEEAIETTDACGSDSEDIFL